MQYKYNKYKFFKTNETTLIAFKYSSYDKKLASEWNNINNREITMELNYILLLTLYISTFSRTVDNVIKLNEDIPKIK